MSSEDTGNKGFGAAALMGLQKLFDKQGGMRGADVTRREAEEVAAMRTETQREQARRRGRGKTAQVNFRCDEDAAALLAKLAEHLKMSKTNVIVEGLRMVAAKNGVVKP